MTHTIPDPIPGSWRELYDWILSKTLCKAGRHSHRKNQEWKFNGGNTCWLCSHCRLIVRYDSRER